MGKATGFIEFKRDKQPYRPVAERLAQLKVRFAFATGYGEQAAFPDEFAAAPKYRKPYTVDVLRAALIGV